MRASTPACCRIGQVSERPICYKIKGSRWRPPTHPSLASALNFSLSRDTSIAHRHAYRASNSPSISRLSRMRGMLPPRVGLQEIGDVGHNLRVVRRFELGQKIGLVVHSCSTQHTRWSEIAGGAETVRPPRSSDGSHDAARVFSSAARALRPHEEISGWVALCGKAPPTSCISAGVSP